LATRLRSPRPFSCFREGEGRDGKKRWEGEQSRRERSRKRERGNERERMRGLEREEKRGKEVVPLSFRMCFRSCLQR